MVLAATVVGLALAWAYSAPPLRLKANGWWGNAAVGFSYEGLAWFTGAAAVTGGMPHPLVIAMALLYSLGAHGIMVLNDFKAIEGDRRMGVRSLPVQLGPRTAAGVACLTMALPQIAVYAVLLVHGALWHALGVATMIFLQVLMMPRLLADPVRKRALVLGLRRNALCVRHDDLRLRAPRDGAGRSPAMSAAIDAGAAGRRLSWGAIVRLGLVQTSLGAIIVLNTSTLNRIMAVELALPAMLPGALVAWHYALQVLRPRWGFGTDMGRRSTPWIVGGMAVLAIGGFLASAATAAMASAFWPGLALAVLAFTLIGMGAGAAGTSLLVLLARQVAPERRLPPQPSSG